jgi:hypothetical protein
MPKLTIASLERSAINSAFRRYADAGAFLDPDRHARRRFASANQRRLVRSGSDQNGGFAIIQQMRCVVGLLICMSASQAQRPEDQVLAVYKQMEKAVQSGDGKAFIALWSRKSAS